MLLDPGAIETVGLKAQEQIRLDVVSNLSAETPARQCRVALAEREERIPGELPCLDIEQRPTDRHQCRR